MWEHEFLTATELAAVQHAPASVNEVALTVDPDRALSSCGAATFLQGSLGAVAGISQMLLEEALRAPRMLCGECQGAATSGSELNWQALDTIPSTGVVTVSLVVDGPDFEALSTPEVLEMFGGESLLVGGMRSTEPEYQADSGLEREVVLLSASLPLQTVARRDIERAISRHRSATREVILRHFPGKSREGRCVQRFHEELRCALCRWRCEAPSRVSKEGLLCSCNGGACRQCGGLGLRKPWSALVVRGITLERWARTPLRVLAEERALDHGALAMLRGLAEASGPYTTLATPWSRVSPGEALATTLSSLIKEPLVGVRVTVADPSGYLSLRERRLFSGRCEKLVAAGMAIRCVQGRHDLRLGSQRNPEDEAISVVVRDLEPLGSFKFEIPGRRLALLRGDSGTGKSLFAAALCGGGHSAVELDSSTRVPISMTAAPATTSTLAERAGLLRPLQRILAAQSRARILGVCERDFSNRGRFRCTECAGRGLIKSFDREFDYRTHSPCSRCGGSGVTGPLHEIAYRGHTFAALMAMTARELESASSDEQSIVACCERLRRYGLGALPLGARADQLSTGSQRLLRIEQTIRQAKPQRDLVVLDCPFYLLDSEEAIALAERLLEFADRGGRVLLVDNSDYAAALVGERGIVEMPAKGS